MTKKELVKEIAGRMGVTNTMAEGFLNTFESVVVETVAGGDTIQLVNFITIGSVGRKEKTGRNPRNPAETVTIPARTVPKASFGKAFKQAVNNG